jgi:tRNA(Arg) A34 adenosine deaminase TadA
MFSQPSALNFELPDWLLAFAQSAGPMTTQDALMEFVIEAARQNIQRRTGGPFAAAIFESDSGALVSLGVNLVTTRNASILHAEMVAIALAQFKRQSYDLGRPDLPAHTLVTSTEPCAMCLGAIPWSGVRQLITGARDCDARAVGFDEGQKVADWQGGLRDRGIEVVTDVQRDAARAVLETYRDGGGSIYNGGVPRA